MLNETSSCYSHNKYDQEILQYQIIPWHRDKETLEQTHMHTYIHESNNTS